MSVRVLNPDSAAASPDPVELSRQVLAEARALRSPSECPRLASIAAGLHGVDPAEIEGDRARLAFWINIYNALLLHRLCERPVRGSVLRHLGLFAKTGYAVGGNAYTLNVIEHGVLRRNRRAPFGLRRPLRGADPRLAAAVSTIDPRIHFALNCGARSCPPVREYTDSSVDELLEDATRAYLAAESEIDSDRGRVTLPRLMRLYRADFGARASQIEFASRYICGIRGMVERGASPRVRYGSFDWTSATP